MLHKLYNRLGLKARTLEKGGDVGGTWYSNRYPGARSDIEGFAYCYSFDRDLLQGWDWNTCYLEWVGIGVYLSHVVDRYDLCCDIQINTEVTSVVLDEQCKFWQIRISTDETSTCRYLVTTLDLLAKSNIPDIPGRGNFAGRMVHTNVWPEDLGITGKHVGVIGAGSTDVRFIIAAAKMVGHLTVLQHSPRYCVPSDSGPVDTAKVAETKRNFNAVWDQVRNSMVAFGFQESGIETMKVSEAERECIFQGNWDKGNGFRFTFGTFCDIAVDPQINEAAVTFIHSKIKEIVKDPETAHKLIPNDLYAKRLLCNEGYYETFNHDNVSLVSIKENPIEHIVSTEVLMTDGVEHKLDVLVFATGSDAVDGNYRSMNLHGRGRRHIDEHWAGGPMSCLGLFTHGFPSMLMILGPDGPFTNLPPSIKAQAQWIGDVTSHTEHSKLAVIEPTQWAEEGWTKTCLDIVNMTLLPGVESWIFDVNISGKKSTAVFYMTGPGTCQQ